MGLLTTWLEHLKEHRLESCESSQCKDNHIKGWPHPWTSELHDEEAVGEFVSECCKIKCMDSLEKESSDT